jgi:hypothetical protein
MDWKHLLALKRVWGVSVSALLFRSRSIGVMSDSSYKRAMAAMSSRGWRTNEPGDIGPPEAPSLFARSLDLVASRHVDVGSLPTCSDYRDYRKTLCARSREPGRGPSSGLPAEDAVVGVGAAGDTG